MSVGTLPCQALAASVTAYGRAMIERTRSVVEPHNIMYTYIYIYIHI